LVVAQAQPPALPPITDRPPADRLVINSTAECTRTKTRNCTLPQTLQEIQKQHFAANHLVDIRAGTQRATRRREINEVIVLSLLHSVRGPNSI